MDEQKMEFEAIWKISGSQIIQKRLKEI